MFSIRKDIHTIIFLYIIISLSIWYLKPKIMFTNNKTMKQFGLGTNKTVFNYQISVIVLALLIFYIYEIYWIKKNNFL